MARGVKDDVVYPRDRIGIGRVFRVTSPENRPHARDEYPWTERLGDVIVCSHFESDDDVRFLALCGKHDNG